MSLDLDDRQRAMLQEMGVRVWLAPAAPAPAADVQRSAAPDPVSAHAVAIEKSVVAALNTPPTVNPRTEPRRPAPAAAPGMGPPAGLDAGVAEMDWPALAQSVAACQACQLCMGRRAPVFGGSQTSGQADWLLVGEPPDEAEERAGSPFAEQAGQLLDNMLKAVGVRRLGAQGGRAGAAYVTNVVKCRPAAVRNPEPQELATCAQYLAREVALVQPKVILALGRFAAQTLLQGAVASVPLGKLRGQVYRYQGVPVVVSYHPSYLLRTPQDKARAWADLCLALEVMRGT